MLNKNKIKNKKGQKNFVWGSEPFSLALQLSGSHKRQPDKNQEPHKISC